MFSDYVKPFGLMSKPSSSFGSEPNKSEEMVIDKPQTPQFTSKKFLKPKGKLDIDSLLNHNQTEIPVKKPKKNPIPPQFLKIRKKKIQKKRKRFNTLGHSDITILSIDPPRKCRIPKSYRRFTVKFKYYLNKNPKKIHSKSINFGHIHQTDYVDHKDKTIKQGFMRRIRNYDTPFKSNFWRVYLLNSATTSMQEAYLKLLKFYGLDN